MLKQRSCLMQVQLRFAASRYGEILQDFRLERCSKTFDLADAVFLCGGLKLGKRGNTELLIESEYLIWAKARDRESAMASPMPGISVSVPAAMTRSSGWERAERLPAARK
jgi:hypothetical protein